ncbi:citramalate synthase [bacterium]|nr:citramalate synthase [bacterium]
MSKKSGDYVYLYDSTLRDGAQARGVDFTLSDKHAIAKALDEFGIDFIEGGWPGANPLDEAFFSAPPKLKHSKLTAFGMTRRAGRSASNDPQLQDLVQQEVGSICIVGKAWDFQVEKALGLKLEENIAMIADSIHAVAKHGKEAMLDAEHFFDGYKANPAFAMRCIETALQSGARWIVLCDTNGGSMPSEIHRIVSHVTKHIPGTQLGIHCHNDTEQAVANSLAAVEAGVRQVQGTMNGIGERCGNANLVSIIPNLMLKMGLRTGVGEHKLPHLTAQSRMIDERLNRSPNQNAAYVGVAAFAHKGGLHASAIVKDSRTYEHIAPETVGNKRTIIVSDKAGRANVVMRLKELGIKCDESGPELEKLISELKRREAEGYSYEGAAASFELLARRVLTPNNVPEFFKLQSFRVMDERRFNAHGKVVTLSEATAKVEVKGEQVMTVAEGNGPVNALDMALRKALSSHYPVLEKLVLTDYKVRILTPEAGTRAITRVLIESRDEKGRVWTTVGVSGNVIDASYGALHDSLSYRLTLRG